MRSEPDPVGGGLAGGSDDGIGAAETVTPGLQRDERQADEVRARARRRRRIDEVFGDVLPETTLDEREPGHHGGFTAEHYRASRPPHWGTKQ